MGTPTERPARFLTEKERDSYFPEHTYSALGHVKKDGIPVRAVLNAKNQLEINFLPGAHSLIIDRDSGASQSALLLPAASWLNYEQPEPGPQPGDYGCL